MRFSKDTLTNLDIFLGDKCNLKCIHCPCWLERNPLELEPALLWDRVAEAHEYVQNRCARFDRSMLIGGEPFSHPGLAEFLQHQTFTTYITVYTNFAHEIPEYDWPENVHFITSMDAADEATYLRTRRTKDFPLVHRNLLRNAPWIIHADTTVSQLNYQSLDDILALSRRIGCTHWLLPIDPRMIRYAADHTDDYRVRKTADRLNAALLDDQVLTEVRAFYDRHADETRLNRFSMFWGLYVSGTKHFTDLPDYAPTIERGSVNDLDGCPAGERYLEITFDDTGRFVPVLYCPDLIRRFPKHTVPSFARFSELIDWLTEQYQVADCSTFCGRTQFLGIDEYKDRFSEVDAIRTVPLIPVAQACSEPSRRDSSGA